MNLEPLIAAPWHVQIHAISAVIALVLGTAQLLLPKGTLPHRTMGVVWILLMAAVTVSSAFIVYERAPGESFLAHYSWIHIFTIVTAFGLVSAVMLLRSKDPRVHKKHARPLISVFIGGLVIAGAFTLVPGRIMHAVVFGGEAVVLNRLEPPTWYFLPKAD